MGTSRPTGSWVDVQPSARRRAKKPMFLVRDVFFDVQGLSVAKLWARVLEVRRRHAELFGRAELFVLDHPPGRGSVCDRISRALPELAPLQGCLRGRTAISSLAPAADLDVLAACGIIATGIPRRFPARWCLLGLRWGDRFEQIPEDHRGTPSPGQDMHPAFSGLKVSRRVDQDWLCASFALGRPNADLAPRAPPELEAAAAELGEARFSETRVLRSAAEARAQRALHQQLARASSQARPRPRGREPRGGAGDDQGPRWRVAFDRAAGALGYERDLLRSEPRVHSAAKRLSSGNLLELRADLGGVGTPRLVGVDLTLHALGWTPFALPIVGQIPVPTHARWVELLEEVSARVPELEAEWAARIDARIGGSPGWFAELGRYTLAP